MGGFKDKDIISDDCGLTKHRQYGQNQRPPRIQQRKNQRERYLNKEEKRDMSAQELDFKLDDNGQVFVQQEPSSNQVLTFKDIVDIPSEVQDIKKYHDYNIDLQQSLNDIGGGFQVELNEEKDQTPVQFDLADTNVKQQPQVADVSNDDLILSEQNDSQQENPFDAFFEQQNKQEETKQQPTQQNKEQNKQEETKQQPTQQNKEQVQQSNNSIDQYLKMQIDDSKLSQENKEKLDAFTSQQLDAFKKFLYEKRNQE